MKYIVIILTLLFGVAWAEPPKELVSHVTQYPVVHKGRCNFQAIENVPCLIFYDEEHKTAWLVLFTEKLQTTHVIAVGEDKKEVFVWVHPAIHS